MAITAAIVGAVSTAGQAIAANQASQRAKGDASKALADAPNAATDALKANTAAAQAAERTRKKAAAAKGFSDTLLTGPTGLPDTAASGKGHATLLGL